MMGRSILDLARSPTLMFDFEEEIMAESTPLQFSVPDMDGESCVVSITDAVKRLDGGASVSADLETKHVVIGSTKQAHEVVQAIEQAGYTVKAA
jgi:copper chaperone